MRANSPTDPHPIPPPFRGREEQAARSELWPRGRSVPLAPPPPERGRSARSAGWGSLIAPLWSLLSAGLALVHSSSANHLGRRTMRKALIALGSLAAALLPTSANAQQTVKIGMINVLSGQFADAGAQLDNGVKTYMKQHGDTVAGKKIEIIRRDAGGPAPDVAKRLAQELIV